MSDDTEVSKPQETVEAKESKTRTPRQPKKITVRPVFGRMVHMLTNQEINGETEVPEIDGWLQAQVDAGKIVVVE